MFLRCIWQLCLNWVTFGHMASTFYFVCILYPCLYGRVRPFPLNLKPFRHTTFIKKNYKFPVTKLWIFRNTKDFLIPEIDYLSRIWHNFLEFWVLNALHLFFFYFFWLYNYFDFSVTDESYLDETRVWCINL